MSSAVDDRAVFAQFIAIGGILLSAVLLGIFLATDSIAVFYFSIGIGWLFLLPYHSKLAVILAIAGYGAALIVPYVPGRPYLWEFAALLAWSGLVVTIAMRQVEPRAMESFTRSPFLFIGIICYCLTLVLILQQRGFGLRILGSEQFGGRFYFQQLTCAVFPLLFALVPLREGALVKLVVIQQLLATTYLVSDFVFSAGSSELFFLLSFFELSGDALNFESQAMNFGIRRYQSLYIVSIAGIWLILYRYRLAYLVGRGLLGPTLILLALFALGLLSGHRYLIMISALTVLFVAFGQRFFNARNMLISAMIGFLTIGFVYLKSESLPIAVQRAASILPGVKIDSLARMDAEGTLMSRKILRELGWKMVPEYLWVGRGFGQASADHSMQWDPTSITAHINQGKFYNGIIGLLVNTGLTGAIGMALFLISGTLMALRILRHLRKYGTDDTFSRVCCVLASLWMANVIAFIFLHGDSEYALKTFALQAGLLIACERNLRARLAEEEAEETATETERVDDEPGFDAAPASARGTA